MKQFQNETIDSHEGIFNASINVKTLIDFNGQTVSAAEYFPVWLNKLADDATLEGNLLNGFVQGPETILAMITYIRKNYERQEFSFAGPFGENFFFENYTAWVRGEQMAGIVMIIRNAAGQAQHIAVNYRPINRALLLSRIVREHFEGTPLSEHLIDKIFDSSIDIVNPKTNTLTEEKMPAFDLHVTRKHIVSNRPFDEVMQRLTADIGKPDVNEFFKAVSTVKTDADLEEVVQHAIGSAGLMEFIRFDPGAVIRAESGGQGDQVIRLVVGNPVIMKKMAKLVPDAAAYLPVSILVDERRDGVHLSFDTISSLIAPYGNSEALAVAGKADEHLEHLLETAAG
jgi:uncharacterized protein (DUF302 family)